MNEDFLNAILENPIKAVAEFYATCLNESERAKAYVNFGFRRAGLTPSPVTLRWQSERRRETKNQSAIVNRACVDFND